MASTLWTSCLTTEPGQQGLIFPAVFGTCNQHVNIMQHLVIMKGVHYIRGASLLALSLEGPRSIPRYTSLISGAESHTPWLSIASIAASQSKFRLSPLAVTGFGVVRAQLASSYVGVQPGSLVSIYLQRAHASLPNPMFCYVLRCPRTILTSW